MGQVEELYSALIARGFTLRVERGGLQIVEFAKLTSADREAVKGNSEALVRLVAERQSSPAKLSMRDELVFRDAQKKSYGRLVGTHPPGPTHARRESQSPTPANLPQPANRGESQPPPSVGNNYTESG